jgi:hypothetical protein
LKRRGRRSNVQAMSQHTIQTLPVSLLPVWRYATVNSGHVANWSNMKRLSIFYTNVNHDHCTEHYLIRWNISNECSKVLWAIFIVLIKLLQHFSASKCNLQGLHFPTLLSAFRVVVGCCSLVRPSAAEFHRIWPQKIE